MKATLMAAGGLLFVSAAFATGMAVPAAATTTNVSHCLFDAEYDGAWLKTDGNDVKIGTKDAEVCKRFWGVHEHDHDDDWDDED